MQFKYSTPTLRDLPERQPDAAPSLSATPSTSHTFAHSRPHNRVLCCVQAQRPHLRSPTHAHPEPLSTAAPVVVVGWFGTNRRNAPNKPLPHLSANTGPGCRQDCLLPTGTPPCLLCPASRAHTSKATAAACMQQQTHPLPQR